MRQTLFLLGPSDIEGQSTTTIESADDRQIRGSANWSGILPIQPFISSDATLKAKSLFGLIGIQKIEIAKAAKLNIFNLVGDPDASGTSLGIIQAMVRDTNPLRCFNRPENVVKTSRSRLPQTLADVPGCRVPRALASDPKSYEELEAQCRTFDGWPLIIRARGYHSGENMVLLNDITQLESCTESSWMYKGVFLIEYIDCRKENMLYEKTRVIMVDGVPYPRHSIVTNSRFIHAKNRSDLMDNDDGLCREEARYLSHLADAGLQENRDIFDAIQQRIGLDVYGIDYTMTDGQMVVFEANACMNFLEQDYGVGGRYQYLERHLRALKRAIKRMLMTA